LPVGRGGGEMELVVFANPAQLRARRLILP
jgi:hypothetical protein